MSILDTVISLNERESKSIKIIMGEVGAGKTSFLKDMPDAAGGNILYIAIGNDMGFNQLRADERFKTLPESIKTVYVTSKDGRKTAIKKRILPQLIEVLEAFKNEKHTFAGLTIDAISSIQEAIEVEIKFEKSKNMDWDDWSAIKKAMFRIYELCEEITEDGYDVALQTHFQIREYTDNYSGETMSRTLPMMTENNAVRILKNADAVVFIKLMPDEKNKKIVKRMSIVGGHATMPTKIRNDHNLSFDGLLFQNLTYGGLIKLMQLESIEGIEGTESLADVTIKKEGVSAKDRKKGRKAKQDAIDAAKEEGTKKVIGSVEEVKKETTKPVKKGKAKSSKTKGKKPTKDIDVKEDDLSETFEEPKVSKNKPTKKGGKPGKKTKPAKPSETSKSKSSKSGKVKKDKPKIKDKLSGTGELVDDDLFAK